MGPRWKRRSPVARIASSCAPQRNGAINRFQAARKGTQAMLVCGSRREDLDLKELVIEASRALAQLDASRLEELALSCQALNRVFADSGVESRARLVGQARKASKDMEAFARILDATRGNLGVINRLRELRAGRLEYGERQARGWVPTVNGHGNH